jgi:glycine/D-amino acid oxidase-like deaminating enzyme
MQVRVSQTRAIDDNADAVIWCTGYKVLQNELWSWLPIEPSKGEILDVEIPSLDIDHILTNGTWILPVIDGNGIRHHHYRIGATHDWDDHDPMPTAKAREYLLQQASMMISQPIIVTGHRAAIRPSTQFKRPIVGRHPIHSKNYVFSGLGTKGALQGPYAARQLADYMLHDKPLDDEINCARWWSRK